MSDSRMTVSCPAGDFTASLNDAEWDGLDDRDHKAVAALKDHMLQVHARHIRVDRTSVPVDLPPE